MNTFIILSVLVGLCWLGGKIVSGLIGWMLKDLR